MDTTGQVTGWRIFKHAFNQVFGNFGAAVRISIPWFAGIVAFIWFAIGFEASIIVGDPSFDVWLLIVAIALPSVGLLWTIVSWHRFVLLEERSGLVPFPAGRGMLAYFVRLLTLGFMIFLPLMILVFIVFFAMSGIDSPLLAGFIFVPAMFTAYYFMFRLAPILPASAIGQQVSILGSFQATKPLSSSIWGLIFVLIGAGFLFNLATGIVEIILEDSYVALSVWIAVTQWIVMMVNVSILTTIYGVAIEGRDLID